MKYVGKYILFGRDVDPWLLLLSLDRSLDIFVFATGSSSSKSSILFRATPTGISNGRGSLGNFDSSSSGQSNSLGDSHCPSDSKSPVVAESSIGFDPSEHCRLTGGAAFSR